MDTPVRPRQNSRFTSLGIQSVRHQVVEQAEGGAHGDAGAIDGGEQGMQVPRLDRPSALQDQAAQGQQVVLGDPVEEVLGHVQGQVDQAGRCDGRVQSLPGQVQPRQPDPRRAVEAAGLGVANPQEVAGDRRGRFVSPSVRTRTAT